MQTDDRPLDHYVGAAESRCRCCQRQYRQSTGCPAAGGEAGADLVACSELVVSGYPPEDLVMKPFFLDKVTDAVTAFAAEPAMADQQSC